MAKMLFLVTCGIIVTMKCAIRMFRYKYYLNLGCYVFFSVFNVTSYTVLHPRTL